MWRALLFGLTIAMPLVGCGGNGSDSRNPPASPASRPPEPSKPPQSKGSAPASPAKPAAPSGAPAGRYVNPAHPAARDSGNGNANQPFRTLSYAMKQLVPGDTLTIAGGVYRDALLFREIDWSRAPTVIQAGSGGPVLIKGSDVVTGWESVGGNMFVKHGWSVNTQQVFVDGVALKQIGGTIFGGYPDKADHPFKSLHASQGGIWPGRTAGGTNEMTDNSFYYDAAGRNLYIKVSGGSLRGQVVEASVRPYLAFGKDLHGITLRNIAFQHANTTAEAQSGAVALSGSRLVLDGIDVSYVDGAGFDIAGDDNVVKSSRGNYCGQVGMKVRGRNNQLLGNETSFNNTRGFNKSWEAGGAKFVGAGGLRDSELSGHRAFNNQGDGVWYDWLNSNNRIHDVVAAYNTGFGLHYEASKQAYIYDNYFYGNGQRGIYLPHSAESVIAYNLIAANGMEGIAIIDEGRSRDKPELVPRGNRVLGNIIAWNGRAAVVLPVGGLENVSDYNLFVSGNDAPARFAVGWGSPDAPVRTGLADWQQASSQDLHSWSDAMDVPSTIAAALQPKRTDVDWGPLKALASRYKAQPAQVGRAVLPPPVATAVQPGPRR